MDDNSSISDPERAISSYEESRTRPDSAFNQFASSVKNVYPEQFDGNQSIRRSYEVLRTIKDLITVRTRFQILGMISIALGLISGLASLGGAWPNLFENAQLVISIAEFVLLALGLTSVGYAEFGLKREIIKEIQSLEHITTESLTHRTLYFGSAQYSIRLGDEGIHFSANRLSAFISYWSVDLEKFIQKNDFPKIDVAPFRDAPLRDVKSGRADGEEFKEFFKSLRDWFVVDQQPKSIALPLVTEGNLLHPKFRETDEKGKSSKKKLDASKNQPTKLESETLIIPLAPFGTNRDSDINPVEFTICLYFAISRAHLDRIKMRVKPRAKT